MFYIKRYGNIYENVYNINNVLLAHKNARRDKLFYEDVRMVDNNLNYYMPYISDILKYKRYMLFPSDYTLIEKNDKGKMRKIYKLDYLPHRIIQWALMLQIQDILLNSFIDYTFASIPNRGIHLCLQRLDNVLVNYPNETVYCLKGDIKKFYPSINHDISKLQYRNKFKDDDLLYLIDVLIDSLTLDELGDIIYLQNEDEIDFLLDDDEIKRVNRGKKGIAIGSLFSQWNGNFYLTPFDRWLKESKKVKFYFRYMDDIVILHYDKHYLHNLRKELGLYLDNELDLKLKDNWQVFPVDVRGIDFVGYRHFRSHILLRKSTAINLKNKMNNINKKLENGGKLNYKEWCSINSYKGWLKWCNAHNLYEKYIAPLEPYCKEYYLTNIKKVA